MGESPALRLGRILAGDNLPILRAMPAQSAQLVYTDPPFNSGSARTYRRLRTTRDAGGATEAKR